MKKVVIIGGGIAGLCAGIFARKAGYSTDIYEKNAVAGGNCSGWKRGDFYIDNCLHWLTGTKEGTPQYKLWEEVGVLGDHVKIHQRDSFYSSELNGETITLWRDLNRTEKELLELSPEDEKEIKRFIEYTRLAETLQEPVENPMEMVNMLKELNLEVSRTELIRTLVMYFGLDFTSLSRRFKHPLLQQLVLDFMAKEYEAYWLVLAYSFFTEGNGGLPEGGSTGVVNNILRTYIELGGQIYFNTPVRNVNILRTFKKDSILYKTISKIAKHSVDGIYLENGTFVPADYVICACDINYAFGTLLKKKYAPRAVKKAFKDKDNNPVYSSYQVAFSVDGIMEEINDTITFECEPYDVGRHLFHRLMVKNYRNYGDYIAPEGKTVIQCSVVQYKEDYKYWSELHKKADSYKLAKKNIADAILLRIEKKYPEYEGKIHYLDSWTPYTYAKRNNCYKGAYMRFITTATNRNAFLSNDIKGLDNVYLASHWLRYPGGIPMAALMGKMAVKRIEKKENERKR